MLVGFLGNGQLNTLIVSPLRSRGCSCVILAPLQSSGAHRSQRLGPHCQGTPACPGRVQVRQQISSCLSYSFSTLACRYMFSDSQQESKTGLLVTVWHRAKNRTADTCAGTHACVRLGRTSLFSSGRLQIIATDVEMQCSRLETHTKRVCQLWYLFTLKVASILDIDERNQREYAWHVVEM